MTQRSRDGGRVVNVMMIASGVNREVLGVEVAGVEPASEDTATQRLQA